MSETISILEQLEQKEKELNELNSQLLNFSEKELMFIAKENAEKLKAVNVNKIQIIFDQPENHLDNERYYEKVRVSQSSIHNEMFSTTGKMYRQVFSDEQRSVVSNFLKLLSHLTKDERVQKTFYENDRILEFKF